MVFTGALNKLSGGGYFQFELASVNSMPVRWPTTDVMVTEQLPHGGPKSKSKE